MPQQTVNLGSVANDGTGDSLRVGGGKINDNFTELYAATSAEAIQGIVGGSNFGIRVVQIQVTDPAGSAITTGDGKAYFRVPAAFNGMNLVSVAGTLVGAVSTSGAPTIQIANVTDSVDMLSTKLPIDASEAVVNQIAD